MNIMLSLRSFHSSRNYVNIVCNTTSRIEERRFGKYFSIGIQRVRNRYRYLSTNPTVSKHRKAFDAFEKSRGSSERHGIKLGSILLLTIPVTTFCLGIWQVRRWRWKLKLIDEMEQKVGAAPVEFPINNLEELLGLEYSKVRLRGSFDCSRELIMGPRSLIATKRTTESQGLISNSSTMSGYHVVSPFKVIGEDLTILVNRGWIPSRNYEKFKYDSSDEIEIIGVVRKSENRAPFMGKNISGQHGLWLSRDLPAMAKYLGTSEIFLDLSSVVENKIRDLKHIPIPGQTRVSLKNDHVSYFFTWFSLSAVTSYMWHRLHILKKPLR